MQSYPYQLINGYPIMQVGDLRVLVNTGSAESMGSVGEIPIANAVFPLKESTLRMTTDVLAKQIGTPMDAMLGADILTQFDFKLLPERKHIVFTSGELHPYGYCSHFELYNGVPITPVSVFNRDMRFFFVTGSRRTYLNPGLLLKEKQIGYAVDYYPGLGVFETPVYKVTVWVAGYDVELEVGTTPAPLISMLNQTNSHGILGVDVLQGFEVCLAPRRRESIWWKLGSGGGEELEGARRDPNDVPGYYY